MIVTCESCRSRFRLDEALLKGAKGARIRCRNCGGAIVLLKPEEPHPRAPEAPRPAGAGPPERKVYRRVEDLFHPLSGTSPPEPPVVSPGKSRSTALIVLLSVLAVLGMALGWFQFSRSNPVARTVDHPARVAAGVPGEGPVYEIRDARGFSGRTTAEESFFVVRGTVVNVGKGASGGIRVRASLSNVDNVAVLEGESFAGNLINEELLPHMSPLRIKEFLGKRFGEGNSNRSIPAGESLPFMVVFFDPPDPVGTFSAMAMDADELAGEEIADLPGGKGLPIQ